MPSVCFYFQVHQPHRLRQYSLFEVGKSHSYFDSQKNRAIMNKVANKCYLPMNALLERLIDRHKGKFKVSFSISGTAIEQMADYAPQVLDSFHRLARTGCVEFLAETYYHSLAAVFHPEEFYKQVAAQHRMIEQCFSQSPKVFRNTELIYSDEVARLVANLGYEGICVEGADDIIDWRSPNYIYEAPRSDSPGGKQLKLLLKNYRLSDDIAFRFSNRGWNEYPLTADKFAGWVHQVSGAGEIVNLFMDYETFGEHQWADSGIFEFMDHLPAAIFSKGDWDFCTPSEALARYPVRAELSYHRLTSWADLERDLTAWWGNNMQSKALAEIYAVGAQIEALAARGLNEASARIVNDWRRLLTSDHFYYMCTKWFSDGDVHAYFSPYNSPYDAFINFMNVLRDLKLRVEAELVAGVDVEKAEALSSH